MKNLILNFAALGALATGGLPGYGKEPKAEPLWPKGAPGLDGLEDEERTENRRHQQNALGLNRSISRITKPTLTIYRPDPGTGTGAAVIICPGGGYGRVVVDKEGHDVARRLQSAGVMGVVLKYRNPRPDLSGKGEPWPLQDVKRAIRLVRSRAGALGLKSDRVGVMGFSAGGHLASSASVHFDAGDASAEDPVQRESCRPDFTALIYPVITFAEGVGHRGSAVALLGKDAAPAELKKYSSDVQTTSDTPPAFLAHAKDDGVKAENSVRYAEALEKNGVRCALHLFEKGGHGFGLGIGGGEPARWPDLFLEWLGKLEAEGKG